MRFRENGCQTSKTILSTDYGTAPYIADTCGSCFKLLVKQPGFSQESRDCAILSLHNLEIICAIFSLCNLEIAQCCCAISRLAQNFGIPRMHSAISRLRKFLNCAEHYYTCMLIAQSYSDDSHVNSTATRMSRCMHFTQARPPMSCIPLVAYGVHVPSKQVPTCTLVPISLP